MRRKKKNAFLKKHAKWLLPVLFFVAVFAMSSLTLISKKASLENNKSDETAYFVDEENDAPLQLTSSKSIKSYSPNLISSNGVYILSKEKAPCEDYRNTTKSGVFAFRCRTQNSIWRGFWTKEIDVSGYSKMQLNAGLSVKDYTKSSRQCNYQGVGYDGAAKLMVFSSDPSVELAAECNHEVGEDKWWDHCLITEHEESVMDYCSVDACHASKKCDMAIDVVGRDKVYLLFAVHDNWFADIEGLLSGLKITLIK